MMSGSYEDESWKWRLMMLSDSALPTGAFAHSLGVEAALRAGLLHPRLKCNEANGGSPKPDSSVPRTHYDRRYRERKGMLELFRSFIHDTIDAVASAGLPFLIASHCIVHVKDPQGNDSVKSEKAKGKPNVVKETEDSSWCFRSRLWREIDEEEGMVSRSAGCTQAKASEAIGTALIRATLSIIKTDTALSSITNESAEQEGKRTECGNRSEAREGSKEDPGHNGYDVALSRDERERERDGNEAMSTLRLLEHARRCIGRPLQLASLPDITTSQHACSSLGLCCGALGVPLVESLRLALFSWLRDALAAAVRLGIVGPAEALKLTAEGTRFIPRRRRRRRRRNEAEGTEGGYEEMCTSENVEEGVENTTLGGDIERIIYGSDPFASILPRLLRYHSTHALKFERAFKKCSTRIEMRSVLQRPNSAIIRGLDKNMKTEKNRSYTSTASLIIERIGSRNTVTSAIACFPLRVIWRRAETTLSSSTTLREPASKTSKTARETRERTAGEDGRTIITPLNSAPWAYILQYGGGLLGIDALRVEVLVRSGATAVVTSQSPGRVFKRKDKLSATSTTHEKQQDQDKEIDGSEMFINCCVHDGGTLFLIPDKLTLCDGANMRSNIAVKLCTSDPLVTRDGISSTSISRSRHVPGFVSSSSALHSSSSSSSSSSCEAPGGEKELSLGCQRRQGGAVLLLDWWTAGRRAYQDESYRFERFSSCISISVGVQPLTQNGIRPLTSDDYTVFRDRLEVDGNSLKFSAFVSRQFFAFATLVIVAPGRDHPLRTAAETAMRLYGERSETGGKRVSDFRTDEGRCEREPLSHVRRCKESKDVARRKDLSICVAHLAFGSLEQKEKYFGVVLRIAARSSTECARAVAPVLRSVPREMIGETALRAKLRTWL